MSVTIKFRRGTSSEWTTNGSTILSSGEPGFEIDTGRVKIGDGITAWSGLYYASIIPTGLIAGNNVNINLGANGSTATIGVSGAVQQSQSLVTTVFNETGSTLSKMTAVYIDGGHGDLPTIQKAIATSDMTSAGTYGLVYEDIDNMEIGQVVVFGSLSGVNTDPAHGGIAGATEGSVLYLSPTVSGALTTTKPYAPDHVVAIGTVVRVHQNDGVIEVRVQNGFELDELHNVAITGATNGQFLQYNSGSGLWIPSSSGNFSSLTINNAQIVTGTGVANHIAYWNSTSGIVADSGQLYWDSTNNRLGIGTSSPSVALDIRGDVRISGVSNTILSMYDNGAASYKNITMQGNNFDVASSHIVAGFSVGVRGNRGTNVGMESAGSNSYLALAAGGSEKVRIDTDGKVGIGTTTPSGQLHVIGTGIISSRLGIATNSPGATLDVRGSAVFNEAGADADFRIEGDTDANLFFVDASTDSIGIGYNTPTTKLQVNGTFSCGGGGGEPSSGGQGLYVDPVTPLLRFNDSGPNYVADIDINGLTLYDIASSPFFYTDRANARIGIGTNSPATTLDVNGVFKSLGFTSYGGISWFGSSDGSIGIAANTNPSGTFGSNSAFAAFQGFNDAVTSYNPICFTTLYEAQLYLNTDGKVGIGTANPSAKLDVNGTAVFGANLLGRIEFGEDTFGGELGFYDNNGNTLALRYADGSFQYGGGSPGIANLVVTSSGNVGIGGIDPDTKLQVYGDFVCSPVGGGFSAKNGEQGVYINNDGTLVINDNSPGTNATITPANGLSLYANGGAGGGTIFSTDRSNSRIGIGTSTPSTTLDVTGDVNIDGNLTFDTFTESVVSNGNSGTSKTLSLASGTVHTCTLTGNCTFTMPTTTAGKSFTMFLNTGSGNYTASFSGVRWSDSTPPTITSTASKVDLLSFISDGTYWYGSFSQNYG